MAKAPLMVPKKHLIVTLFHLFLGITIGISQQYQLANQFTTKEGLPSNHIYDIVEDNKGFLWVTSDNGLARFDGKNFYTYTVKNGLPSNDVLQVITDQDGIVWANCYKELPSYFDETANTFVSIESNQEVNRISNSLLNHSFLPNGSIRFYSDLGHFDVAKTKVYHTSSSYSKGYINLKNRQLSFWVKDLNNESQHFFAINGKVIDTLSIPSAKALTQFAHKNRLYSLHKTNQIVVFSNFKWQPFTFDMQIITFPDDMVWYKISDAYLSIIGASGLVHLYDLKTLQLKITLQVKGKVNSAYIDKGKRIWIGTLENGLLYYDLFQIATIATADKGMNSNFLSICVEPNQLFAGNYNGQVFQKQPSGSKWYSIQATDKNFWIRDLIYTQKKAIAFGDAGFSSDLHRCQTIFDSHRKGVCAIKSAIQLNDSIMILGSLNGLLKMNAITEQYQTLNSTKERILNIAKKDDKSLYYVSPQGIFYYDYNNNQYQKLPHQEMYKHNKPAVLACEKQLMWVATEKGDLFFYHNNQKVASVTNNSDLPETITDLVMQKNKLWIASKSGVHLLKYTFLNNRLRYTIHKLSSSDGLSSNVVNDLALFSDTLYVATGNGISVIPTAIQFKKFDIQPHVIRVLVNNKKKPIQAHYFLNKDEKNISIELAGVELSGHFKHFQYALNDTKNWIDLSGQTLNLSLKGGEHLLYIRAVDVNNNYSRYVRKLKFEIAIPFYATIWFLVMIVFGLTAFVFWIHHQRKLNQHKIEFQQKMALEQQRGKIIADLHDDIGATLSSLQINSSVANQLIDNKPDEAKKALEKIENQSKNLADKIGDIIWSMKPGKDEFMSMSTRVKNFANDILGATNINYSIQFDKKLDQSITDITLRKNIVLLIKEAINNAAKYSKATHLSVDVYVKQDTIFIAIVDDGVGFDIHQVTGNGLPNMKKRVDELHGTITIESELNHGTQVRAQLPLSLD